MADLRVVPAAIMVWVALLNTGTSYAADKIALICSATIQNRDLGNEWHDTYESLVIELDKKTVSAWGELGGYPLSITSLSEDSVYFKGNGLLGQNVDGS